MTIPEEIDRLGRERGVLVRYTGQPDPALTLTIARALASCGFRPSDRGINPSGPAVALCFTWRPGEAPPPVPVEPPDLPAAQATGAAAGPRTVTARYSGPRSEQIDAALVDALWEPAFVLVDGLENFIRGWTLLVFRERELRPLTEG